MKNTTKPTQVINRENPLYKAYKAGEMISFKDGGNHPHKVYQPWDESRTRCSYSNGKTGIPSVSFLAGDSSKPYSGSFPSVLKSLFEGVTGTCSCDCPGCYAKAITRNIEPAIKYALNTIEMKEDPKRFIELVEKELFTGNPLQSPRVVRLHDSGEIYSVEYWKATLAMVKRHPETIFGTYTKATEIVTACGVSAEELPHNLVINCSPWKTAEGVSLCDAIADLPQYIYDDGTNEEIAKLPHCPAVDKNGHRTGKTCAECLHCYTARRGDRWAVYAH
jgi:hypothetical protein